jgi:hypothetical protein
VVSRIFAFVQAELPWQLGPVDGRWLLRSERGDAERVLVLGTVGARPRRPRVFTWTGRSGDVEGEPAFPVARATVIDPVPMSAERQAQAWLEGLDPELEVLAAFGTLNKVLFAHRIASADPHVHEVAPSQALAIRAGYGEGEHVADGRWLRIRELPWPESPRRRSVAVLRPQERLAALLGAREAPLQCEEHTLRARVDLDHGRLDLAARELDCAYALAVRELAGRPDLYERVSELTALHPDVAALAASGTEDPPSGRPAREQALAHALARLEAALRARTAGGIGP